MVEPDGKLIYSIVEEHVRQKVPQISPPLLRNWTKDMSVVPNQYCYSHIYEYLVKRTVTVLKVTLRKLGKILMYLLEFCLLLKLINK